MQQIHTFFPLHKIQASAAEYGSVFSSRVIQWELSLTKYYNQLYVKPALLDTTTKPDFQHCQAKKYQPVFTIHVCLYLSLLQMEPSGIPPEKTDHN